MPRSYRQRESVIRVPMEHLDEAYAGLAADFPWLGVSVQRELAAEYIDKAAEITPQASGTMAASWDPAIERSRKVTRRGSLPTAAMARRRLRGLRPGQDALVSNNATAAGQSQPYAELIWRGIGSHASDDLPGGGQDKVIRHLRRRWPQIARRAIEEFVNGDRL